MEIFVVNRFLLTAVIASLIWICRSDTVTKVPRIGTEELSASAYNDTGVETKKQLDKADASCKDNMSDTMESHLLELLQLTSVPVVSVSASAVPGYMRAVQSAVDTAPPSAASSDADRLLTWAVKAAQGISHNF